MSKDKRGRKCKGRHCAWCKPVKSSAGVIGYDLTFDEARRGILGYDAGVPDWPTVKSLPFPRIMLPSTLTNIARDGSGK